MSLLVVDASVVVKWMLPGRDREDHVDRAMALFDALRDGRVQVVQPAHWLAEVAAVLARLSPETAADDARDLVDMDLEVDAGVDAYVAAVELACALPHHMFDTLYHGVALTRDALLVTADERYYDKARSRGGIVLLRDLDSAHLASVATGARE